MPRRLCYSIAVFLALLALSGEGWAQQVQSPGRARAQGQDVTPGARPIRPSVNPFTLNYREEIRRLVQSVGTFARRHKKNFVVLARNGLDLLVKVDEIDDTKVAPARTYARSIDGVLQDGLLYGDRRVDRPTKKIKRLMREALLQRAKDSRLAILVADYATERTKINESYKKNGKKGFVTYVAPAKDGDLNRLAAYPRRPNNENSGSVISLNQVKNFAMINDSSGFGGQDEFALKVHDTNYDMVIVDVFHGRDPLSKQAVETLKYKKLGTRRLVLARLT